MKALKKELDDRGVDTDAMDKATLKQAIEKELAGMRRPPALLCSEVEMDLTGYEVAHVEPLHDIKTTISMLKASKNWIDLAINTLNCILDIAVLFLILEMQIDLWR